MTAAMDVSGVARRVVLLLVAVLALTGCQLDVVADVVIDPDGTGSIVVTAEADAELVDEVPTITDDLVLDDVRDAGWEIVGPDPTPEGGLTMTLSHGFADKNEATNLLRSLGPPFNNPTIARGQDGNTATNTVRAVLGLPDGFASFADDDLVAAVGGVPFADRFAADDIDPANSMSAVLRVNLPGDLIGAGIDSDAETLDDGRVQWTVPFDGSVIEASAESEQAPSAGGAWARPVSIVALVAFCAWVAFMALFVGYVAFARWRRSRRYRRRSLPLAERGQ